MPQCEPTAPSGRDGLQSSMQQNNPEHHQQPPDYMFTPQAASCHTAAAAVFDPLATAAPVTAALSSTANSLTAGLPGARCRTAAPAPVHPAGSFLRTAV
jgi:hypothetical protein